jgi:hypothetical protein
LDRIVVKVAEGSLVPDRGVVLDEHEAVRVVVHGLPGVRMTEAPQPLRNR